MDNKIEKYKNSIDRISNMHIKNSYISILNLLKGEKTKGSLTPEEFNELKEYLDQKHSEIENDNHNVDEFKKSLKVEEKALDIKAKVNNEEKRTVPEKNEK